MSEPLIESASIQQPKTSSWFNNFNLSPNITNQLTNLSSSIYQATSKVTNVANTFVQKSMQQPQSSILNEETSEKTRDLTSILTDFSSNVFRSAQQLKQVVEEKSILGNFTKEHEKFLTDKRLQQQREEAAVPPWIGYKEEEDMKKQILGLSQDKRNFLRHPPPGANYHFDMTAMYPIALATLEVDENLKQMRFNLVPKQITEESFWCNYFYRVSLIKQSTQLTALTNEKDSTNNNNHYPISIRRTSELQEKMSDINQEFVSEDYDTSTISMDDIRREIEQLSITKKNKAGSPDIDESEWDKALADELENVSAEELEAQINQMLAGDTK